MNKAKTVDIICVVSSKDLEIFLFLLKSLHRYWKPSEVSHLIIRTLKFNRRVIENVWNESINKEGDSRFKLQFVDDDLSLISIDYLQQRYLKISSVDYSDANYFWIIDSDYILIGKLNELSFFTESEKIPLIFSKWIPNSQAYEFKIQTEKLLGLNIPYNFMAIGPYFYEREVLLAAMFYIESQNIPFSEFVLLGYLASSLYNYELIPILNNKSFVKLLQQDINFGVLDLQLPQESLSDSIKVLVFWSHWGELRNFLSYLSNTSESYLFSRPLTYKELMEKTIQRHRVLRLIKRRNYDIRRNVIDFFSYEDGWVYPEMYFTLLPGFAIKIPFYGDPNVNIEVFVWEKGHWKLRKSILGAQSIHINFSFRKQTFLIRFFNPQIESTTRRNLFCRILNK